MHRLVGVGFALALVPISFCQAKSGVQAEVPPSFTIAIDGPAYATEPIWVRALNGQIENVRYPFSPAVGDFGCNKLEVRQHGTLLTPRANSGPVSSVGIACGSSAPAGSPQGRLPLHILYPLTQPGTYSVRWTIEYPDLTPGSLTPLRSIAESPWLTFAVLAATPEQHQKWVRRLLANAPKDPGHAAGDFIPSLVADAPDPRALSVLLGYLYAENQMVAGEAASALELFPQSVVMRAVVKTIEEHGPSEQLAYYATYHKGWTLADEEEVVHAAVRFLVPPHTRPVAEVNQPENPFKAQNPFAPEVPTAASAAIKLLGFIFYTPNHAWPSDSKLNAWTDAQVLRAAPKIMASADTTGVQQLAEYLGSMQPSADAHELLLRIADRDDVAGEQAKICLGWHRPN